MVQLTPTHNEFVIHRTYFFYFGAGIFLIVNMLVWFLLKLLIPKVTQKFGELSAGWIAGLPSVINIYLAMLIGFIGVINNPNDIPMTSYEYLNYLGPIMLITWVLVAFYLIGTKKNLSK
jgi:hypothetical protein